MTNSGSDQEINISQSVFARARSDTQRFLSTPSFWFMEVAVTALVATVSFLLSVPTIITIAIAAVAPILLILLSGLFTLGRAPLMQRNETRWELVTVRERLRPKLRLSGVRKSYDTSLDLANALVYLEYLRIEVANESDKVVQEVGVSITGLVPLVRYVPTVKGNTRYTISDPFDGYTEVPFPVSLTWSDHTGQIRPTLKNLPAQGKAQVDALSLWSAPEGSRLNIAFASLDQRKQFELPETEVVFAVRLDGEHALPRYYVLRYLPNVIRRSGREPWEILHEGPEQPNLEDFRIDTPAPIVE